MQKMQIGIILLAAVLLGGGCSSAPAQPAAQQQVPAGYVSYTGPQAWTVHHPKEWTTAAVPNSQQTFLYPPYDAKLASFSHNVNVVVTPNQKEVLPLDTLRASVVEYLSTSFGAVITNSKVETFPFGDATVITYTVPAQEGGVTLYGKQVGFYEGTTLYVLTFTAGKDGYDAYADTVQTIFKSFRPAGSAASGS